MIAELLQTGRILLGHAEAPLEAELLLAAALQRERSYLFAYPEADVSGEQEMYYRQLLADRKRGVPIAYLLGWREFWSLRLQVNPHTLIPRPETEHLVEAAVALIKAHGLRTIADLGTGSGAIALALAKECPACRIIATDVSAAALTVAAANAVQQRITGIEWRQGSWFEPCIEERYDLIVSNPPYISTRDPHLGMGDLRFEPRLALASGADGLDAIRVLIAGARDYLRTDGWLAFEHGYEQGEAASALLKDAGYAEISTIKDYDSRDRVTLARVPG